MNSHKLIIMFLIFSFAIGCSPEVLPPSIQADPTDMNVTATALLTPSVTVVPSPTLELKPDFPDGCANLTAASLDLSRLNGLLIVFNKDRHGYFLDLKSNQILEIEDKTQISANAPDTDESWVMLNSNKNILIVSPISLSKHYAIIRTADEIIRTYDTQGQEDWNRGRWLDEEHMVFQNWFAPHGSYTIVIYNPFTGEQKNMQINLPNPYIVQDTGGSVSWVKADIDPSLKRVLYNDKDGRLVLWDLDTQKDIASLPSPTDLIEGTWSPDGEKFAIRFPSLNSAPTELFIMDMDGTVTKLTDFSQNYPFANVYRWPSWSPDGRLIAYWLKISNTANADPTTLRQWLAITNTTTLDTQIYCLSPNKPPTSGGKIVWNPDSTQVIVNTDVLSEKVKPVLVDLIKLTQTELDTHGLMVTDWMAP